MVKIHQLEIENVKRVKAVTLEPDANGLTIIGGRNNQGKTSVLDAIAWALGGDKFRPSEAARDGSVVPPRLHVVLSNGLVVERSGKNGSLKVTDPQGNKGGQQLLNEFVNQLALDLPRFLESSSREKAQTLLHIIGVEDELSRLERREQELYHQRRAIGQIADQKKKYAKEMTYYPDAPMDLVSAGDLIRQQQDILARNGENQKKRMHAAEMERQVKDLKSRIVVLEEQLEQAKHAYHSAALDLDTARKSANELQDESTEELEKNIRQVEEINRKVRANLEKEKAEEDFRQYASQYEELTSQLESTRNEKIALLQGASLPLEGLSVEDGELTYNGHRWDNISGSDQLRVATAIVRRLNPKCGFVLLDKLEQMDLDTLQSFGEWLKQEGLQAIATRVSTGGECSILIEDGYISKSGAVSPLKTSWKAGEF